VLDTPVEELAISVRLANCLKGRNIRTVRDLVTHTESDMLRRTKNFGRKSLKELKQVLLRMGLALGMVLPESEPSMQVYVEPANARRAEPRPVPKGWDTTDEDEVRRRLERATSQEILVVPREGGDPIFSTFTVSTKGSPRPHMVEVRSVTERENTCDCPDFRVNGLGTCKHIEATLLHLEREKPSAFAQAKDSGSPLAEVFLSRVSSPPEVAVSWPARIRDHVRHVVGQFFSATGEMLSEPVFGVPALRRAVSQMAPLDSMLVRVSREVDEFVADMQRHRQRTVARNSFMEDVKAGRRHLDPPGAKLFPYQRDGALHLAFGERALLADDMGLGKTVQAIVACEILRQTRHIERVLVVGPVSLKAEWEEQIRKFCNQSTQVVLGPRTARLRQYRNPAFFNLVNYEQVLADHREIVEILAPDVVILDEAQRVKNWQTKTAQAVRQLSSPFAFVLTGTPLENRIDEIYSIVQFLDQQLLGPLFRFNREYYKLDDRGRPVGYQNLDKLHRTVRTLMLRRLKSEVEEQLPERQVSNYFVPMSEEQRLRYQDFEAKVARLMQMAQRRPLRPDEFERMQQYLACMRMLCDTTYILDPDVKDCPKLPELMAVMESVLANEGSKIIVFSEWERMLMLVREALTEAGIEFVWHTGSVPQAKRRDEINRFKNDPKCRVFLSTDSGATGLNLQIADTVINLDLPWNPARLEQRIARAWRKFQTRTVQVINLVTEDSIEHRMLTTIAAKRQLAEGVLDGKGNLDKMELPSGRGSLVEKLAAVLGMGVPVSQPPPLSPEPPHPSPLTPLGSSSSEGQAPHPSPLTPHPAPEPPLEPAERFRQDLAARLADRLLLLESRVGTEGGETMLLVVDCPTVEIGALARRLLEQSFGAASAPPLEILDRSTFDLLRRLASNGVIQFDQGGGKKIHAHESFKPSEADLQKVRREEARKLAATAARDRKLAGVMAVGGFPIEALAPLSKATETLLRAVAHAAAGIGKEPKPLTDSELKDTLVAGGILPATGCDLVLELRRLAASSTDADESAVTALIPQVDPLLTELGKYLEG